MHYVSVVKPWVILHQRVLRISCSQTLRPVFGHYPKAILVYALAFALNLITVSFPFTDYFRYPAIVPIRHVSSQHVGKQLKSLNYLNLYHMFPPI